MFRRSKEKIRTNFRKDIPEYSDEQIINILKQRDHYQPEAAQLAVEESIRRGIIHSEQDLFAEEYKVEPLEFSLFPKIRKPENQYKIRKSIARSMVVLGVIPIVYGFLQINRGITFEGYLILAFGILWIYFSAQLIKQYLKIYVNILFVATFFWALYMLVKLTTFKGLVFFDYFIPGILALLVLYGLFFLKRNATHKTN